MPLRRHKTEPYVQVKVNLRATVNALVEEQLWDPVLRKPRYAARSSLVENLLIKWLEEKGVRVI